MKVKIEDIKLVEARVAMSAGELDAFKDVAANAGIKILEVDELGKYCEVLWKYEDGREITPTDLFTIGQLTQIKIHLNR